VHPIQLNVNSNGWRVFLGRKQDPSFVTFSKKILQRDDYTCQFCEFQADEYQEIVNLDQNYRQNKVSNLVTACVFCAQCFFLQAVGTGGHGGGTLIYLPELSQAQLNHFCHVLFIEIVRESTFKEAAQDAYRSFKLRSQVIEKEFGDGMSDPAVFGQILIELDADKMANMPLFEHMRLLPSRAGFQTQIGYWSTQALAIES